ncbi:MAG: ribosome biogenesis GTP-binding protein YihA/YsxC [Woeseiaceae bacterium]|nr:ribosome biogenesis GTP-binding protein YihA/YsxC [Woeseiaceae bacterium]
MSQYPEARFVKSADAPAQFPADSGVEVAVAGRSNAGKSSAINVIVNRRQFARTSRTPGRTRLVNFFELAPGKRLVDLPGYGFARVSDAMRRHWDTLLTAFFRSRESLAGLLLVVDIRRGLTDFDRQMLAFAEDVRLPIHVLLTKADKLKRGRAAAARRAVEKELGARATVQVFSALKREGEQEARARLDAMLGAKKTPGHEMPRGS